MEHREKWTAKLAKKLENLPAAVQDWAREPESDEALPAALVSCITKEGVVDAGDPLSGGAAATDAHEGTGGIPDPLSGLNTVGEKRGIKRRGADENLFGQVDKMPKTHDFRKRVPLPPLSVRPKAGAILTLGQRRARSWRRTLTPSWPGSVLRRDRKSPFEVPRRCQAGPPRNQDSQGLAGGRGVRCHVHEQSLPAGGQDRGGG